MNDTLRPSRRRPALAALALSSAALLVVGGCGDKASEDAAPPAAPYGTAASPSPASPIAATAVGPTTSGVAAAPSASADPAAPVASPSPGAAVPAADAPPAPPAGMGGPVGAAPFGGISSPTAPLTPTPELDKAIADAEKGADKKAIAAAYAKRGTFRMNDEKAGARVKYRAALDDYRKSLALDPKNEEATRYKKVIEDIYTSMGRPIPGA